MNGGSVGEGDAGVSLQLRRELAAEALLGFASSQGEFTTTTWEAEEEQQGIPGIREDHLVLRGSGWELAYERKAHRLCVTLSTVRWRTFCRTVLKLRPAVAEALSTLQQLFWYQEVGALGRFRVHLDMLEPTPGAATALEAVRQAGPFPLLESLLLASAGQTDEALARLPEGNPDVRARLLARTGQVDLSLPVSVQTRLRLLAQVGDWRAFLEALSGKGGPDATDRNLLQAHCWLHLGHEGEARAALKRASARYPAYVRNWVGNEFQTARQWLGEVEPHSGLAALVP